MNLHFPHCVVAPSVDQKCNIVVSSSGPWVPCLAVSASSIDLNKPTLVVTDFSVVHCKYNRPTESMERRKELTLHSPTGLMGLL